MDSMFLEQMRDLNCDVDGALKRCVNDETFYKKCVRMAVEEPAFASLGEALKEGDAKSGFEYAHTLKGVWGNVGITPLYEMLIPMVEQLRAGDTTDMKSYYERLVQEREKFMLMIKECY